MGWWDIVMGLVGRGGSMLDEVMGQWDVVMGWWDVVMGLVGGGGQVQMGLWAGGVVGRSYGAVGGGDTGTKGEAATGRPG